MNAVLREARRQGTGVAVVAHRGPSPFGGWVYMPEGFFKKFGMEAVATDGDRVLMAVDYGPTRRPVLLQAAAEQAEGVTYIYHRGCPASMWGAAAVKRRIAERGIAGVTLHETASPAESRRQGALCGVSRDGTMIINRLAFWADVAAALGINDNSDGAPE